MAHPGHVWRMSWTKISQSMQNTFLQFWHMNTWNMTHIISILYHFTVTNANENCARGKFLPVCRHPQKASGMKNSKKLDSETPLLGNLSGGINDDMTSPNVERKLMSIHMICIQLEVRSICCNIVDKSIRQFSIYWVPLRRTSCKHDWNKIDREYTNCKCISKIITIQKRNYSMWITWTL